MAEGCRRAESLATPETECLLYATYWFRSILSELIGATKESADVNRERAPSGAVKVVVTNQLHSRRHTGVDLVSGVSALLAWFLASWASKIAPCFIGEEGGVYKDRALVRHRPNLRKKNRRRRRTSPARGFLCLPPSSF